MIFHWLIKFYSLNPLVSVSISRISASAPTIITPKEAEDALTKSLLFLEQQRDDGIAIRADDLSVISRLINQVAWHRMSRCKQTPIEKYVDLH